MDTFVTTTLNGVSYAFILFLLAAGFSLTFGVMGVLNMAHGSLYMVGAYIGMTVVQSMNSFILAIVIAAIGVAIIGLLIERLFLKRLYKRIPEQAVLTIGLSYAFANIVLWVWGPFAKIGQTPSGLNGSISVGDLSFPVYRIFIVGIGVIVLAVLWWLQDKTRIGAIIRAGMDNKDMTISLGINYAIVSTMVFTFGAMLGGIAGILGSPIIGAYSTMGDNLLLLAFIVVVVGGTGYVQGTMLGALIIGLMSTFGNAYFSSVSLFTVYMIFIITLLIRPNGILGRKLF
jgi:branched-chain amino acid transport system permease protein